MVAVPAATVKVNDVTFVALTLRISSSSARLPQRPVQAIEFGPKARVRIYASTSSLDAQGANSQVVIVLSASSA
jgi:hypothetical protein